MKKITEHIFDIEELHEALECWLLKYHYLGEDDTVNEIRVSPLGDKVLITVWE